jgi:hypothetical protein
MSKLAVNRSRQRVRLITFNDVIIEGDVFISYNQRVSDLLNDDRDFLPIMDSSGEMRVMSKRAVMEIQLIEAPAEEHSHENVVGLVSGNAHELLGASAGADDATIRAIYLDRIRSVDPELIQTLTENPDLIAAAAQLRSRYIAAYDAISHSRQIEAIAEAMKIAQVKAHRI